MEIVVLLVALAIGGTIGWFASSAVGPVRRPTASSPEPVPAMVAGASDDVMRALEQAVDGLQVAIVIFDAAAREIYRNSAARAMVGTHAGVVIDAHVDEVVAVADRGQVERPVSLHGPPRRELVVRAERLAGGGTVVLIEDISEGVRIDAVRTDFVANISHELKTPVGAIAVLAETLVGERDIETVERMSQRIVDEAHRAVETIDDLLELSRIEVAGVGSDVIELREVVAIAIARARAVDQSVEVTAIGDTDDLWLRADRRQLVSALGNLLENAVKYSERGDEVQVRTRVDDRHIEIMVIDHGVGIPERDLHRIFERFYRVDRSRQRETGGTGLGLAIVRHVATNHGGDVIVSSEEGEGSTFMFRLPSSLLVTADAAEGESTPLGVTSKEDA